MGRRREHDEGTAEALLDAAERLIGDRGVDALSLRQVAVDAGTTTRAVYTLYGSKVGLFGAIGVRAVNGLAREIEALPATDRPRDDLVQIALVIRRFALEHRAVFEVAVHRADPAMWSPFRHTVADAIAVVDRRFAPLAAVGLLGGRSIGEASTQFRALAEGLAWTELRGTPLPPDPERFWRHAFHALISGFAVPDPQRPEADGHQRLTATTRSAKTAGATIASGLAALRSSRTRRRGTKR